MPWTITSHELDGEWDANDTQNSTDTTDVTITFYETNNFANPTSQIQIIGDIDQLGNWDLRDALDLQPVTIGFENTFTVSITVPSGTYFEYKFIDADDPSIGWEAGPNHGMSCYSFQ